MVWNVLHKTDSGCVNIKNTSIHVFIRIENYDSVTKCIFFKSMFMHFISVRKNTIPHNMIFISLYFVYKSFALKAKCSIRFSFYSEWYLTNSSRLSDTTYACEISVLIQMSCEGCYETTIMHLISIIWQYSVFLDIKECETQNITCVHGTCEDAVNNFTCMCVPGYEGRFCEIGNWRKCLIWQAMVWNVLHKTVYTMGIGVYGQNWIRRTG